MLCVWTNRLWYVIRGWEGYPGLGGVSGVGRGIRGGEGYPGLGGGIRGGEVFTNPSTMTSLTPLYNVTYPATMTSLTPLL